MDNGIKEHFTQYFWNVLKKQYADFTGLADRKQFWFFIFWNWIISTVLSMAIGFVVDIFSIISDKLAGMVGVFLGIVLFLIALALIIPNIAIQCRRFRDVGISPWWVISFPVVWLILTAAIAFLFTSGRVDTMAPRNVVLTVLGIFGINVLLILAMVIICVLPSGFFNKEKGNLNIIQK